MPVSEKSYTFRAPEALAPRLDDAIRRWTEILEAERPAVEVEHAVDVLVRTISRRLPALRRAAGNQSALLRETTELFVASAEMLDEERRAVAEYDAWARDDEEARVRDAFLEASAERWRDD